MVATFEPGLACMVTATDDGGMKRIHAGNLEVAGAGDVDSVDLALALPFFAGAILLCYIKKKVHQQIIYSTGFLNKQKFGSVYIMNI